MIRFGKLVLSVAALVCVTGFSVPAVAAPPPAVTTVGDFVVEIANLKKLPAKDANMAGAALRTAGYDLPRLSPTKALTEGDVSAIANALGLKVASSNPTRSFNASQMNQFLMTVGFDLQSKPDQLSPLRTASGGDDDQGDDNDDQGKKPTSKSPKKPHRSSSGTRK